MSYSPLSLSRRHVLGELYLRCDSVVGNVPVFIAAAENDEPPNVVGHMDQSLGAYVDAFTFHLPEDICKLLSGGYYSYSFEYEFSDPGRSTAGSRVRLSSVCLTARRNYAKPIPRGRPMAK